tara:strand:- start:7875 stop:8648 length:774 start_codon:yes stop_codon:yes gene_type:complete
MGSPFEPAESDGPPAKSYHTPYGTVYVLTGTDMTMVGSVIDTNSFMLSTAGYSGIMGFDRQLPEDLGAVRYGVNELDYTAGTTDEANLGDGTSATFLKGGSLGLGYIPMITYYKGWESEAHLFFNYSNMSKEASFEFEDSDVSSVLGSSPIIQQYVRADPVTYYSREGGALKNKFGYDDNLTFGEAAGDIVYNGIAASVSEMVDTLISTFPISKQTFKRTKPMKIRAEDVNALIDEEAGQVVGTTTTTTTSTPTTSY